MTKKSNLFGFFVPVVLVVALHILKSNIRLSQSVLNLLFIWGFLGLVVINILLFVVPLCVGLGNLKKSGTNGKSQEQEGQKNEKALEQLLQGENTAKGEMPGWAGIGIAICIGLIVGSVLGFILNRIIT